MIFFLIWCRICSFKGTGYSVILDAPAKYGSILDRCTQLANANCGSFCTVLCRVFLPRKRDGGFCSALQGSHSGQT